jgi:hypothetical protein
MPSSLCKGWNPPRLHLSSWRITTHKSSHERARRASTRGGCGHGHRRDSSRQRHQVRGDEARARGTGSRDLSRPELHSDRTAPGTRGCPRGWHQINTKGILIDLTKLPALPIRRRRRPWLLSLPIRGRWLRNSTASKSARISESGGYTRAPHAVRKEHRDQACVCGVGAQRIHRYELPGRANASHGGPWDTASTADPCGSAAQVSGHIRPSARAFQLPPMSLRVCARQISRALILSTGSPVPSGGCSPGRGSRGPYPLPPAPWSALPGCSARPCKILLCASLAPHAPRPCTDAASRWPVRARGCRPGGCLRWMS